MLNKGDKVYFIQFDDTRFELRNYIYEVTRI